MSNDEIATLSKKWLEAKDKEREAVAERREIEDRLKALINFDENSEGTTRLIAGDASITTTSRLNRKVDADKLQDIAAEHGLTDHLSTLFRWKPEINMALWKKADESITAPLLEAITTSPSRPSFSIKLGE